MDTFDSVQWRSEAEDDTDNSRPTTANPDDDLRGFQAEELDPHDMEAPQAGPNADAVDLAGVGNGTLVTNVSDPQTVGVGTGDAFVSYLVTTDVRSYPYIEEAFKMLYRTS